MLICVKAPPSMVLLMWAMRPYLMHRLFGFLLGLSLIAALTVPAFAAGPQPEIGGLHAMHAGHGLSSDCCDDTSADGTGCLWGCLLACTAALRPIGPSVPPVFDLGVPIGEPALLPVGHRPPTTTPPPKRPV